MGRGEPVYSNSDESKWEPMLVANSDIAWGVALSNGNVNENGKPFNNANYAWCVRGPMQHSAGVY